MEILRQFTRTEESGERWKDFYIIKGDHRAELLEELETRGALPSLELYKSGIGYCNTYYYGNIGIEKELTKNGDTVIYQNGGYNI